MVQAAICPPKRQKMAATTVPISAAVMWVTKVAICWCDIPFMKFRICGKTKQKPPLLHWQRRFLLDFLNKHSALDFQIEGQLFRGGNKCAIVGVIQKVNFVLALLAKVYRNLLVCSVIIIAVVA